MSNLTIVANIHAKKDQVELVKAELLKLIKTSLEEPGCVNYDLHQNNTDPSHFIFYENWESREQWLEHINNKHITNYVKKVDGAIEGFFMFEATKIS